MNSASFDNAYREIGRELGLKGLDGDETDIKSLVKAALSRDDSGSWLLIVDNADDFQLLFAGPALINYLPFSRKGSILVTTRNHETARRLETIEHIITLKEMSNTETVKLLQGLKENQISDTEKTARLLELLAHHPLAVKQASAYMARTGFSTAEYLDYCQLSNEFTLVKLLSQDFEDLGRYTGINNSIVTTLLTLFNHISQNTPIATQYLKFISILAEKDIPITLYPPEMDERLVRKAVDVLIGYGLVLQRKNPDSFDIHRLVRLVVRRWIDEQQEQVEWTTKAIQTLSYKFPVPRYENKAMWLPYLPHGRVLLDVRGCSVDEEAIASLLFSVAESYSILGIYKVAEPMHQQALELRKKVLGREHPSTIISIYNLASVLRNRGQYQLAENMYLHTLKLRKAMRYETDCIVDNMNSLALVLRIQGKYAEAKYMYHGALELGEKVLGMKHPDILSTMAGLAIVCSSDGNHQEAENLLRKTLALTKDALGIKHSGTLDSMNGLAIVLSRQRKYEEAAETFRQTLELRKAVLGLDHPHTLDSMNNLANVLYSQGRYEEAEQMQLGALELRMKILGGDHPDTLVSRRNLELILRRRVDYRVRH